MLSPSSKSSGARRFLPADDDEGRWSGNTEAPSVRLSGVRALKTAGWTAFLSGVLGRGRDDGPEAILLDGVREIGVIGM